jgi:hypothetical protein
MIGKGLIDSLEVRTKFFIFLVGAMIAIIFTVILGLEI